jgi:hypothetical protein
VNLPELWRRATGDSPRAQRERLAQAIAAVGPFNPEPHLNHFLTSELVVDGGETLDLGVLVVSEVHDPRWLDVTQRESHGFTTYRYYLLPDRVQVVRPNAVRTDGGDYVDAPVDTGPDSQRATRLFDLGLALLHRQCQARDAAHASWRSTVDRASALQVISALFGPWDYALRAATNPSSYTPARKHPGCRYRRAR